MTKTELLPRLGAIYHQGRESGHDHACKLASREEIKAYIARCERLAECNAEAGKLFAKNEYLGRADGAAEVLKKQH